MKLSWFTTDDGQIRTHSLVVPDDEVQEMASDIPGWIERHGGRSAWEVPDADPEERIRCGVATERDDAEPPVDGE